MSDGKIKRLEGKVDISEEDYRKEFGINSTALSQFSISQDHCLLPFKHKSYFEDGKIFETLLRDTCTGSNFFAEKYFTCDVSGKMPDNLISLIESGADLELEFKYNNDGSRSKTQKVRHAYLDKCLENKKGKFPVGLSTQNMMETLVGNMLKMELLGATALDILSQCLWQVPIFWQRNGIFKKALLDCVYLDGGDTYAFDIKTSANESQFYQMSQKKYHVQRDHYSEGVEEVFGGLKCFDFLVAYKEAPFLCEPVTLSGDKSFEYRDLCRDYVDWLKIGKPPKGYLPHRKILLRNT